MVEYKGGTGQEEDWSKGQAIDPPDLSRQKG